MRVATAFITVLLFCCCGEREAKSHSERQTDTHPDAAPVADPVPSPAASGDSITIERYANGTLKYLVLAKDSGDCKELHLAFYANGRLKSKGCQGTVTNAELSTGMSVGTWSYFDSLSGNVDSTFLYDNSESAKAFIEKRTFYPGGQLKSVERFNNYILYETEMQKKGAPKYYDEHGKLRTVR